MKKTFLLILCISILSASLCGCGTDTKENPPEPKEQSAAEIIMDIPTTQYFTDETVSDDDTKKILLAGINAPSAMNGQKWHFTAITDKDVLQKIADSMGIPGGAPPSDMKLPEGASSKDQGGEKTAPPSEKKTVKAGLTDAPLAIVISCPEGADFDAGLACQNMSAEANLLGYGTKILSSTAIALNGEKKPEFDKMLNIPDGYSTVAVLIVGKKDTSVDQNADTYASATPRNPFDETVTYVK